MRNYVQRGEVISTTAPSIVASGDPILIGSGLFGIACHDANAGAHLEVLVQGVVTLPATGAIAQGDVLYFDASEGVATTSDGTGSNVRIGHATSAKMSNDTVHVRLAP